MNKLITLLFGIFLISSICALDDLGTFKQNECVRVVQTCSTCSYVNISSISYPNSSLAFSNIEMVSSGSGEWYYDFCLTNDLGRYDVRGQGNLDGIDTSFATYFEVKSDILIWVIIIFVFAFIFLILSTIVNEELFVYISGVSFLLAGVVIMIYGIDIINDWTTRSIAFISIGLGILFTLGAYVYNGFKNSDNEEEY